MDKTELQPYSTSTNASPSPRIDLDQLQDWGDGFQKTFLGTFKGVPVRVDDGLQGNEYYCAVSQEIYDALRNL